MDETTLRIATKIVLKSITRFGFDFLEKEPVDIICEEINKLYKKIDNPDESDFLKEIAYDVALHATTGIDLQRQAWEGRQVDEKISSLTENYLKALSSLSAVKP